MSGARPDADEAAVTTAAEVVRRWEASGGSWRVVARHEDGVELILLTCTGDEEMGRVVSSDPELLAFVGQRGGSDE